MRKKFYLSLTVILVSAFIFFQLMLIAHEKTHFAIYRIFGYNSTIHIEFLFGYVTLDSTLNETDSKIIRSLQSVVELESYQLQICLMEITTLLIVILILVDSYFFKLVQALDLVQRFEEMQKAKKLAAEVRR
jgi:hypothetical protein